MRRWIFGFVAALYILRLISAIKEGDWLSIPACVVTIVLLIWGGTTRQLTKESK